MSALISGTHPFFRGSKGYMVFFIFYHATLFFKVFQINVKLTNTELTEEYNMYLKNLKRFTLPQKGLHFKAVSWN